MRLNFFSRHPARTETTPEQSTPVAETAAPQPITGSTFPADEVVWGIAIRNGFDEIDDPWYHRGMTQHAYLEGNDAVALCGFRPPQTGPRHRRRARLGLPSVDEHPMCGMCARSVVAPQPQATPQPRVVVPVQPARPVVAVPVTPSTDGRAAVPPMPAPVAAAAPVGPAEAPMSSSAPPPVPQAPPPPPDIADTQPVGPQVSPWVRRNGAAHDTPPGPDELGEPSDPSSSDEA